MNIYLDPGLTSTTNSGEGGLARVVAMTDMVRADRRSNFFANDFVADHKTNKGTATKNSFAVCNCFWTRRGTEDNDRGTDESSGLKKAVWTERSAMRGSTPCTVLQLGGGRSLPSACDPCGAVE